jgi:Protein of unknown function (DUF707)/Protein of unknown function (DUF616)
MPIRRRLVVYTTLIGDYEYLNDQPISKNTDIKFACLTDSKTLTSDTWSIVTVDPIFVMDPIRSQRLVKFNPWEYLRDYEASLYIDNSVRLLVPPEDIFAQHSVERGMTLPAHSFRESVLDEFLEVARLGFDDQFRIFEQLNHYQIECPHILKERPLWAAILIREHGSPSVRRMADIWSAQVLRYSRRDQLSINLAIRRAGLTPKVLEIDNTASWLHTWPHTEGRDRDRGPRHPAATLKMPIAIARQTERQLLTQRDALQNETAALRADVNALRQALAAREDELAALNERLVEREAHLATLDQSLLERGSDIGALRHALAAREDELAALNERLVEREAYLATLHQSLLERASDIGALRQVLSSMDATISALHTSTSWRITAPLRAARRRLSRLCYSRVGYSLALACRASTTCSLAPLRNWRAVNAFARSEFFDREWYLRKNPDVAESGIDPVCHYVVFGAREGRDPKPSFSTRNYLSHNPDFAAAVLDPRFRWKHRRRVLVVVRAGDASLHPGWLQGASPESRNWDLHLSYFGKQHDPFPDRPADVTLSVENGTKATGTVACLNKLGYRVSAYDWVWLPDDDLKADLPTLNRFFAIVCEYHLDLAQPALGSGSYISHDITLQRPHMKLRFTTFVEIMAACFSRRALAICRPYLAATISSCGPNHLFPRLLGYPTRKIAIVDETPVVHTRSPGLGPNIALVRSLGISPEDEYQEFMHLHGLTPRFETWGAIDRHGKLVADLSEIDRVKASIATR